MAKILTVPTSGSIGNTTFSRNRNGQYIRQRSIPTQPRTSAQINQRARLTTAAAAWRGLTAAQMASWTAFGNSFTVVNSLGQSNNLTGLQAYTKVNTVNALNGDAQVSAPPALPVFLPATVTGITVTAGTQLLEVSGTTPAAGTKFMIYASPQKSAGVSFVNNYGWLATFTTATAGQFVVTTPYSAKFGTLVIGKKVFVKVVQSQAGMQDNGTVFSAVILT
jgi:hypothetical protein